MQTRKIQLRIPENWHPKILQAARDAGFEESHVQGKASAATTWIKAIIASHIGETATGDYHLWRDKLAECTYDDLKNFRDIFSRYVNPEQSPLHQATYELGAFLQDNLSSGQWGLNTPDGDLTPSQRSSELLIRAVMHAVYFLAFGDIRVGGGSPPREKARNLAPKISEFLNRHSPLPMWLSQILYAGQELCVALQYEDDDGNTAAKGCSDLVQRSRQSISRLGLRAED